MSLETKNTIFMALTFRPVKCLLCRTREILYLAAEKTTVNHCKTFWLFSLDYGLIGDQNCC